MKGDLKFLNLKVETFWQFIHRLVIIKYKYFHRSLSFNYFLCTMKSIYKRRRGKMRIHHQYIFLESELSFTFVIFPLDVYFSGM